MDFRQSVTICNLSRFYEVERCVDRLKKDYGNGVISLHYSQKKVRRAGGAVIYLCDDTNVEKMSGAHEEFLVFLTDIPCFDICRYDVSAIYDVIYMANIPDEWLRLRFRRIIGRVHSEYSSQTCISIMQDIIDTSPDMIWVKDINGRHIVLNDMFCTIVGKDRNLCINREHPEIWGISWDEYKSTDFACRKSEEEVLKSGKTGIFEENVLTDGEIKKFKTYKTPLYDRYGNTLGTCGIGHDITNLKNLDLEMSILIDNVPFPMCVCSPDRETIRVNQPFLDLADVPRTEEFDYCLWLEMFTRAVTEKTYSENSISSHQEIEVETDSGTSYYILAEQAITDFLNNVVGYFIILSDISYRKKYEDMLKEQANTDALTQLYNRRYIVNFLNNSPGEKFTLLYMDIDSFKEVNDRFGHKKGDEVLRMTAAVIRETYPEGICARLGGDEFIVLLSDSGIPIQERNRELQQKLHSFTGVGDDPVISLSIGVSENCIVGDVESFFHDTDQKMYEVKKKHKASGL